MLFSTSSSSSVVALVSLGADEDAAEAALCWARASLRTLISRRAIELLGGRG